MLVAAPERWDEACFAVPAVRALMASGLGIGVLCRAEQEEFWKTLPDLEVMGIVPKMKAKALAAQLGNSWKSALVWEPGPVAEAAKIAQIPRRLGPAVGKLPKLVTHPLAAAESQLEHRVRFYLSMLEEMGVPAASPEFFMPAALGIDPVKDAVLLSPDSDFGPSHEWLIDRWLEIAGKLLEQGKSLTVASLNPGRSLGKELASRLGDDTKFFEASPLAGVLPILAAHAIVVAADSSLPHLAAHAGATCVTLFGPNDPAWKRPLGRRHGTVRRHVECAPCLLRKCPLDMRCQNELESDRVWATVLEKTA